MREIWSSEGVDPFSLFMFLFSDHPVATLMGTLSMAWAGFAISSRVPLVGLSTGRNGAKDVEKELPNKRAAHLARIRAADPAFEPDAFVQRAIAAFAAVDDGLNSGDLERARLFMSDGMHESFLRLLAERAERGVRERISELQLRAAEPVGYLSGPHYDAVYVSFSGVVREELVKAEGAEVVAGGKDDFTEVWTFLRRRGAKTRAKPGPIEGFCPSCGAPLKIADAGRCGACSSWVDSAEHDWILTEITRFEAWAFPDPDREVGGWKALTLADPDLSLPEVEDRAAAVFWRWLDARRREDPAPLAGVATPEFLAGLAFDGRFEREAQVAGVETTACQARADFDRVHVQVSWTADQMRREPGREPVFLRRETRTFFFIFRRRAGTPTDAHKGLHSARCPSCGATPREPDLAACGYCGHAFNDGSLTWVLDDAVPCGRWRRPGF
jgi:hypothetical protein